MVCTQRLGMHKPPKGIMKSLVSEACLGAIQEKLVLM
jgi:hypothetical protein